MGIVAIYVGIFILVDISNSSVSTYTLLNENVNVQVGRYEVVQNFIAFNEVVLVLLFVRIYFIQDIHNPIFDGVFCIIFVI